MAGIAYAHKDCLPLGVERPLTLVSVQASKCACGPWTWTYHNVVSTMKHHNITDIHTCHACAHGSCLRWAVYLRIQDMPFGKFIYPRAGQPNGLNMDCPRSDGDLALASLPSGQTYDCLLISNRSEASPCSQAFLMCLQECKISKSFGQNDTQVLYTFDDKSQPLDYQSLASNLQTQLGSMMSGYSSQQEVPAAATPTVSISIPTVSSIPSSPATPSTPSSAAASSATGSGTATGEFVKMTQRLTTICACNACWKKVQGCFAAQS